MIALISAHNYKRADKDGPIMSIWNTNMIVSFADENTIKHARHEIYERILRYELYKEQCYVNFEIGRNAYICTCMYGSLRSDSVAICLSCYEHARNTIRFLLLPKVTDASTFVSDRVNNCFYYGGSI